MGSGGRYPNLDHRAGLLMYADAGALITVICISRDCNVKAKSSYAYAAGYQRDEDTFGISGSDRDMLSPM